LFWGTLLILDITSFKWVWSSSPRTPPTQSTGLSLRKKPKSFTLASNFTKAFLLVVSSIILAMAYMNGDLTSILCSRSRNLSFFLIWPWNNKICSFYFKNLNICRWNIQFLVICWNDNIFSLFLISMNILILWIKFINKSIKKH
jgi:hypothetical protein